MSTVPKEQKKNLIANSVSDQSMIISYCQLQNKFEMFICKYRLFRILFDAKFFNYFEV